MLAARNMLSGTTNSGAVYRLDNAPSPWLRLCALDEIARFGEPLFQRRPLALDQGVNQLDGGL